MEQEVKRKRGRPRKNPPATLPTFADRYEEELKIPEDYFEPGYQFTLFDFTA